MKYEKFNDEELTINLKELNHHCPQEWQIVEGKLFKKFKFPTLFRPSDLCPRQPYLQKR